MNGWPTNLMLKGGGVRILKIFEKEMQLAKIIKWLQSKTRTMKTIQMYKNRNRMVKANIME